MYLTVHTPISLIIGTKIKNPFLAFALAFLAHFILDSIPHDPAWQAATHLNFIITIATDFLLLFFLLLTIKKYRKNILKSASVLSAIAGGILPDVLWGINIISPIKFYFITQYQNFHHWVHLIFYHEQYIDWRLVILSQGLTFLLGLLCYLKISNNKTDL
ncbi:MAG TPA: hypothetical protein PLK76_02605 [bacterium]|nr:hypothetical protein [bacterium]